MVVAPNTTIYLLTGVPLDNTYTDTIYFSTSAQQFAHFSTQYAKKVFGANTYQRVHDGVMRLAVPADEIYNYNYLMFQNTNYGNKWFYGFIQNVRYINNATSEITYEIDVMQTYHFDYILEQCYVERETTVTDERFEHLEDEPVELGELVCTHIEAISIGGDLGYGANNWGVLVTMAQRGDS